MNSTSSSSIKKALKTAEQIRSIKIRAKTNVQTATLKMRRRT